MTDLVFDQNLHAVVASLLNEQPQSISPIVNTFGGMSATYTAVMPGRTVIVRINPNAEMFRSTARNIDVLRRIGLPVPKVLACDTSMTLLPAAIMVLEKIPGRDLRYELASMTRAQMTALAEKLVEYQHAVTRLPPGSGFGYAGIGEQGPHSSWWAMIQPNPNSPLPVQEPLRGWADKTNHLLDKHKAYFLSVPPTCFLDDITVKNVLVQDGELQGLVDFDCVCYGDPLWWISLTAVGTVCDVGSEELFYVAELARLWRLSAEEAAVFPLYCAMMGAGFYTRHAAAESEAWRLRMTSATEAWLARASE